MLLHLPECNREDTQMKAIVYTKPRIQISGNELAGIQGVSVLNARRRLSLVTFQPPLRR